MATTNYNLPTISGASPVAIVDDYNALANSTDAALAGAISGEKTRAMAAETELANGVSNALTTANTANVSATNAQTAADQASTAASAEATRATAAENALSADIANVKAMFPVDSANLADGSVTAPKLADTALNAIWQGLEIKRFDMNDSSADNTGLSAGTGVTDLAGFYVPALTLLVITNYSVAANTYGDSALPSYVPTATGSTNISLASIGMIAWSSSDAFIDWTGLALKPSGKMGLNTTLSSTSKVNGTVIAYLAPFTTAVASAASDYIANNGMV